MALKVAYQDFVRRFCHFVGLRVVDGGEVDSDPMLFAEFYNPWVVELGPVVHRQGPREAKSADDALPDEVDHVELGHFDIWFCLHPVGEVICCH